LSGGYSETMDLDEMVEGLVDEWERETCYMSSPNQTMRHPAFHKLVSLGDSAVGPLLRLYKRREGFIHMILSAITGLNPVDPQRQGDVRAARRAWLAWGRANAPVRPSILPRHLSTTATVKFSPFEPVLG
jgi:hypothetical protein